MEASELRIGNWITDFGDGYGKVTDILLAGDDYDIGTTANSVCQPIETFTPIKLTPEILEAAGFEKEKEVWKGVSRHFLFPVTVQIDDSGNIGVYVAGGGNAEHIKHLHQLQNLFYSLTSQELEIKIPATA